MFKFTVLHVVENQKGHAEGYNYSLVGRVPLSLLEAHKPTAADVMAGRVQSDGMAYKGKQWKTVEEIQNAAKLAGVELCAIKNCACRKLFNAVPV